MGAHGVHKPLARATLPCCMPAQVMYLQGLKWVYQLNIFLYMMFGVMGLSLLFMVIKGPAKWKRAKRIDAYKY